MVLTLIEKINLIVIVLWIIVYSIIEMKNKNDRKNKSRC